MKPLNILSIFLTLFSLIFVTSCSDDDSSAQGTSKISVKLVDDPGDYDEVNVEVIDVLVRYDGDVDLDDYSDDQGDDNDDQGDDFDGVNYDDDDFDDGDGQWLSLNAINTGVVNLLDLTAGENLILVNDYEIPSGSISQIRLVLGENNTVVMDGVSYPLMTPSGQQSGLKIKVDALLEANFGYNFILDFDVDKSIVIAGNSGNKNLKPVMRATIEAFTGAISGQVEPAGIATEISATMDNIEFITTNVDENGNFLLAGVPPGSYTVTITPNEESLLGPIEIMDVEVIIAQTTDMGTVDMDPED